MIVGRLTSKAQTTVPRAVRTALKLQPGDRISYEIAGDEVVVRRWPVIGSDPFDNPLALFTEWASEADCEAFKDL